MKAVERLYKRAAVTTEKTQPLWYVGNGVALFAGTLGQNKRHAHSASVFLAGLSDAFLIRIGKDRRWRSCRTAVIPAGIAYEFDMRGAPLNVLYLEPNIAHAEALSIFCQETDEVEGALVGRDGEITEFQKLYEDPTSPSWVADALSDLISFSDRHARRQIDPRISVAVNKLQKNFDAQLSVSQVAESVNLSSSRFQHLFTSEVGVPFRRYRSWHRLRAAIREVINGKNYTVAAHAAGFYDQAHFIKVFRKTFGAPPSPSLSNIR